MTSPDDQAFPRHLPTGYIKADEPDALFWERQATGLTKREWFAGMALGGMTMMSESAPKLAAWAVEYADACISELNKKP